MICWFLLVSCHLLSLFGSSGAYDSLDPYGNITIRWDFKEINDNGVYTVMVNLYNYQLYRHIESPGWKLSWKWAGEEVIWDIRGAEATEQGDCSRFKGAAIPHTCEKRPVVLDLLPGAPYNVQVQNCCRGGVLPAMAQDPSNNMASFQMSVGTGLNVNDSTKALPSRFSLGILGYTCGEAAVVPPTKFSNPKSRHRTQALLTWQVTCSFSQFRASPTPNCCVSLSTFYNDTVVACPHCSCGCQSSPAARNCAKNDGASDRLQLSHRNDDAYLMCTQHMCPIRVHWHLKVSYKDYWRVKVAITNFNLAKNYSDWNLVVQHPNLRSLTQVFSFNYKPLIEYGKINDTGMFWGVQYYNQMVLQAGEYGNVQSEMLFHKDPGVFTFEGGWAFPRKIIFNGLECVMPPPNTYPSLPRRSIAAPAIARGLFLGLFPVMLLIQLLL